MIQEILNFIGLLGLFFLLWILGAIGHELFHGLACYLQGSKFKIGFWWHELKTFKWKDTNGDENQFILKLPSMACYPQGTLKDYDMFYYLGGIGIGSVYVLTSMMFYFVYMPLFITLFLVGIAHFFYGIYEGLFIRKVELGIYMVYHYLIYLISIGIGMVLIRKQIVGVILNWKLI